MSVVRLDGREAGIAVHEPHALDDDVVDIGMYVDPVLRRRGVGSSILALTARRVLDEGRTPVAGCWWRNWASRVTIEAAGPDLRRHDLPAHPRPGRLRRRLNTDSSASASGESHSRPQTNRC